MKSPSFPESFIPITNILRDHGLHAPQIYQILDDGKTVILEDFGDMDVAQFIKRYPHKTKDIYKKIVDILIAVKTIKPNGLGLYTNEVMLKEACVFIDWYRNFSAQEKADFKKMCRDYLNEMPQNIPQCLVLRDVHVNNFMVLKDESIGILDYQDALLGPVSYDIISLLEDARIDIDPLLYHYLWDYFCAHIACDIKQAARIVATVRHLKIIGVFCRYAKNTGKKKYLAHLPRLLGYLEPIDWVSRFL